MPSSIGGRLVAVAAVVVLGLGGAACSDTPEGSGPSGNDTPADPIEEDRGEDGRQNPTGSDSGGGSGVPSDDGSGGSGSGGTGGSTGGGMDSGGVTNNTP